MSEWDLVANRSVRPMFAADEMLGSLARWLRVMGYDTVYEKDRDDTEILSRSREEGRILLTRDKVLAERAGAEGLYIGHLDPDEQLEYVIGRFSLTLDEELTRCAVCNGELERISGDEALRGGVPEGSVRRYDQFYRCTGCGKHYWKGSHWDNIRKKVQAMHGAQAISR